MASSQYVLITGASRGIGQATALAFAKAGVGSILVGRSADALMDVAKDIRQLGVDAYVCPLDLSVVDRIQDQLRPILETVGAIDILVNNAGIGYTADLIDTPLSDWQRVLDLNLTAPLQCIQAVLPQMRSQGRGTIVNVISVAGRQTFPNWGAYCASKFGLMGLTKTLSQEERSHGIRVVALCPGSVDTPIWDSETVQANFDRSLMLRPEDVADAIVYAALMPAHAVVDEWVLMPNTGTF